VPALYRLEVHTPYRPFFFYFVEAITLKLSDGEIGVYAKHSPFTAPVLSCELRIKDNKGQWQVAFISGGILEVTDFKTLLLVEVAEWPEEIDRERAIVSERQARESLEKASLKFETDNANEKIRRSQLRLKIAGMANHKK
jgi:F-type H+-transporting ATPase subunit epsilon